MFIKANCCVVVVVMIGAVAILTIGTIIAAVFFLPNFSEACIESSGNSSMGSVVFVRHGESEWNSAKLYTGWYDAMLTETGEPLTFCRVFLCVDRCADFCIPTQSTQFQSKTSLFESYIFRAGIKNAKTVGHRLNALQIRFDFVHTSLLTRAIQTTELILHAMSSSFNGTINTNWLLNERHYGALTGNSKSNSNWTTHWSNCPPPMLSDHPYYGRIHDDPRYQNISAENGLPNTESLANTEQRFIRHWLATIGPQVQAGGHILVVAHQNLLRSVIKYFDQLPDAAATVLQIANSAPFKYEFDEHLISQNKFTYLFPN